MHYARYLNRSLRDVTPSCNHVVHEGSLDDAIVVPLLALLTYLKPFKGLSQVSSNIERLPLLLVRCYMLLYHDIPRLSHTTNRCRLTRPLPLSSLDLMPPNIQLVISHERKPCNWVLKSGVSISIVQQTLHDVIELKGFELPATLLIVKLHMLNCYDCLLDIELPRYCQALKV